MRDDTGRSVPNVDRHGRALAIGDVVMIPATVTSLNQDIVVVALGDPMPPHQLTLEADDVVKA
jgi:hypothetical protein